MLAAPSWNMIVISIKYNGKHERILCVCNENMYPGRLSFYNWMTVETQSCFGVSGTGDDYFSLARDGTPLTARAKSWNKRLKYFPEINVLFGIVPGGFILCVIIMNVIELRHMVHIGECQIQIKELNLIKTTYQNYIS